MSAVLQPGSSTAPTSGTPGSLAQAAGAAFKDAAEGSAVDRLNATRACLRGAMMDISHPPVRERSSAGNKLSDSIHNLFLRVKTLPGAALVVDSLESWWRQHPLRTAGAVAGQASRSIVGPIAERNPATLLLGATAVGALFMLTKPWRWLLRPALFVGLVPQIATHALRRMPIETWLRMMTSLTARRASPARATGLTRSPAASTAYQRPATATPSANLAASTGPRAGATRETALP